MRPQSVAHCRLPRPLSTFVGRDAELTSIAHLLGDSAGQPTTRLLTLTGAPGAGKTRLAIEAAARLASGEVAFVDLSEVDPRESGQVPTLIERALAAAPIPAVDGIAEQPTLLVVDNFEHVIEAATGLSELLSRRPSIRALVTSQRPLRIHGEQELVVLPLGAAESVELFVQRARARAPDFELTPANTATVAEICRQVDGLPLAIELAAARIRLLPPTALLRRLADRLDLLAGGRRDDAARHHSLRAAIDWSYQLLATEEQRVLRCLSVFGGGFTLSAAEAILGMRSPLLLDTVQALLDNGLLRADSVDEGEPRYRMLETVRQYAAERLIETGEAETARGRYVEYYLAPSGLWPGQPTRLAPAEFDNLRFALEGVLTDSLALSRRQHDRHSEAIALDGLGGLAAARGDFEGARAHYEPSARMFADLGDELGWAIANLHLGAVAALAGNHAEARQHVEAGVSRLRAADDVAAIATSLRAFAKLAAAHGHSQAAARLSEAATSLGSTSGAARQRILDDAVACALALDQPAVEAQLALLTARERQVASLLAEGLTNRQIGQRLIISERTAEGHIEHLRNKLGVSSRAQIAAWYLDSTLHK